jgi:hypothetical protein
MRAAKVSRDTWAQPLVLAVFFLVAASVAVAQDEPRVGTWELNLAKSTFASGPSPKKQTLTFQAAGPHWTALLQGIDASGKPINPDLNNLAINFDGKDHPTANVDYDTTLWRRISAYEYEALRKKAGKLVSTITNVVSQDGKTMTISTKGVNAAGQSIDSVRVFEKR